ncbi:hypothetical protein CMI47_03325 [Candidatus Pacearchaeota archaeon]|nr:hypothetical protein [Candidatus Pacearchaeota archaeon]|tara:strand:- start:1741 stop:2625 length:885 start_codon:yes stop_codon:yes gene_type:complete
MSKTKTDEYWARHTVRAPSFKSADESLKYLNWRSSKYPFFHELMGLFKANKTQTVLDYGCGPGNDVVGYACLSDAKKVIGVDISNKAINLAKKRLLLHGIDANKTASKVRFVEISDSDSSEGGVLKGHVEDSSIDHIYCQGVLHHTTNPKKILEEFYRVLKTGSSANIMIYNRNSIFYHLYVGYIKRVIRGAAGTSDEVFKRSTDGSGCPVSYATEPKEYISFCNKIGFSATYKGGYMSDTEMKLIPKHLKNAILNLKCEKEHSDFLKKIKITGGYPYYENKLAGIGGVYILNK